MRIIFAGTPEFASVALQRLHASGFAIALALTQPDRPAGRGMKTRPSAVGQLAANLGIPVAQPRSLRLDGRFPDDAIAAREAIAQASADAMVVAAYGLLLPQWVLDMPRLGSINIHASLLPRWRGAAPIQRAVEAGDEETGITIMQMDAGLDTGDMLLREALPIGPDATAGTLHDELAVMGGRLCVEALELAACGGLRPRAQPQDGVTYARKIDKAEAFVDWSRSAQDVGRHIRAFDPSPGASAGLGDQVLKLWGYEIDSNKARQDVLCGTILSVDASGIAVACGEGVLRLTQLQRAGGKRLGAAEFLRGFALSPGTLLAGRESPSQPRS